MGSTIVLSARLQPEESFFASTSQGFFGTKTVKNNLQLSNVVSSVSIDVFGNVICNHNPKHIYTILRTA